MTTILDAIDETKYVLYYQDFTISVNNLLSLHKPFNI